jgi:hypothetical protein
MIPEKGGEERASQLEGPGPLGVGGILLLRKEQRGNIVI